MNYKKLAILKIILGASILLVTFFSINVFADEVLGMTFFLLGIFLLVRGGGYFIFRLFQYIAKSYHKYEYERMTEAYKLSLLFSCFILINIILIVVGKRTKLVGINVLLAFIIVQILLIYDRKDDDE